MKKIVFCDDRLNETPSAVLVVLSVFQDFAKLTLEMFLNFSRARLRSGIMYYLYSSIKSITNISTNQKSTFIAISGLTPELIPDQRDMY